jgi:hypothetical protein
MMTVTSIVYIFQLLSNHKHRIIYGFIPINSTNNEEQISLAATENIVIGIRKRPLAVRMPPAVFWLNQT